MKLAKIESICNRNLSEVKNLYDPGKMVYYFRVQTSCSLWVVLVLNIPNKSIQSPKQKVVSYQMINKKSKLKI